MKRKINENVDAIENTIFYQKIRDWYVWMKVIENMYLHTQLAFYNSTHYETIVNSSEFGDFLLQF